MNRSLHPFLPLAWLTLCAATVQGAPLILNEYNAVSSANFLNGGDALMDEDDDETPPFDSYFGRIVGNGGDWFELVVVADALDVRGWTLQVWEDGVLDDELVFADHPLWSALRAGTVITVAEDVPDDVSYDPDNDDWWIQVQANADGDGTYISAQNFSTSNDDWQLIVLDAGAAAVFGPAGEGTVDQYGIPTEPSVNAREVWALESNPNALTREHDPQYDDGTDSSFGSANAWADRLGLQSLQALRAGSGGPDLDGDRVVEDGSRSGVAGDDPCVSGAAGACDDNCPLRANHTQTDSGSVGVLAADGIGDACQCGDANGDGVLTQADGFTILAHVLGVNPNPGIEDKCSVSGDDSCDLQDALAVFRVITGTDPTAVQQVCAAATRTVDKSAPLYDPQKLLQVSVQMDPQDYELMRQEETNWDERLALPDCGEAPWPSPYNWYSAQVTIDGETFENVGIRKKGFVGSVSSVKPALKLHLDRFTPGQALHGVTRLTLNNARTDNTYARQCVSFDFFNAAGIPAPRCNFATVLMNEQPLGVYVNVEPVEAPFLQRKFANEHGKLYEGTTTDFWPSYVGVFEPETNAAEADNSELLAITDAVQMLTDQALLDELALYLDVEQFITYWAAEALVAHRDGYHQNGNNFFVYVNPSDNRMSFFPWDADQDFTPVNPSVFDARMALARKLYNIPSTRTEFLNEVQRLIDTVWDAPAYSQEVTRIGNVLSPILLALGLQNQEAAMLAGQADMRGWIDTRAFLLQLQLSNPPGNVLDVQIPHPCDGGVVP